MRFFLDTCLALRHARALHVLFHPDHSFTHLQDKFDPSAKDADWLLELGKEGGWIVISGDYRIGKSPHEKEAWHQSRLTAFFLAKGWTNIPLAMQHSKLTSIMDVIISF